MELKKSMIDSINISLEQMDWESLDLPSPKNSRPRCGELGAYDYWRLHVASKLVKKSLAQTMQTAIHVYLSRSWAEHERRLILEAKQQGISPEDLFMRYLEDDEGRS